MVTDAVDLYSYYTNKLTRWKGNYPRIFSISFHGLTTYNHDSERTNSWQWTDVFSLSPASTLDHPNAFQLVHRKGNKSTDTMRFETPDRVELLTKSLAMISSFARSSFTEVANSATLQFNGAKYCHGATPPDPLDTLTITPISLEQTKQKEKKVYYFKDLDAVLELTTVPGTFAIRRRHTERLHTFTTPNPTPLLAKLCENASHYLGHTINLVRTTDSLAQVLSRRLGIYSGDQISLSEFTVQNVRRGRILLCLTESCLVEREASSYVITSLYPLSQIFSLVRCTDDAQGLNIEFTSGVIKTYFSTERDSLLASLMDGTRAGGNTSVHVQSRPTPLGKRWGGLSCPVDEKVESLFLKFLHQPPSTWSFHELLIRFNANVEYSGLIHSSSGNGLFAENKEKLILVAINALIARDVGEAEYDDFFQLVRRLVCSKTGFGAFSEMQSFRERLGSLVVSALRSPLSSETTIHSALEAISALIQPMHSDSDLRIEQENKEKVLNSAKFLESLLDMWTSHIKRGTGALVTMSMLDILTFALCAPYSETTMGGQFDALLIAVGSRAGVLFSLFQHPSIAIVKGAGLIMKALIEEGQNGSEIQDMALKQGALIRHLLTALFVQTSDPRMLTLRQLSRHLIQLWTSQHEQSKELLARVFPPGILLFLSSTSTPPTSPDDVEPRDNLKIATAMHKTPTNLQRQLRSVEKFCEKQIETALKHWRLNVAVEARKNVAFRPVALRKRRQNLVLEGNWPWFYYGFGLDWARTDLIANFQTREELRVALEHEIRLLDNDREHIRGEICWNFADFQVQYKSLNDEIRVGGYYLRLLLDEKETDSSLTAVRNPKEFFADLYHRFLLTGKPELRGMCLQAMTIVYQRYCSEIGIFNDLKFIVLMLEKSLDKSERDRLILFIQQLVRHPENARELVGCGGLKVLVDLIPLAHLHTSRAPLPTMTNVIEAGSEMKQLDSPEWYYMKGAEKLGPIGFRELKNLYANHKIDAKTKTWASGLDSWKQLSQIPQCKWFILCEKSPPLMNESKLATVILDILIQILEFCPAKIGQAVIRPVHRAKQILTDANSCFPHIVQVLLTFDPAIVERVASLLCLLLDENPFVSRVYATGAYFFIMMYTGSNILPVSRFLHLTHLKQNTYTAQTSTSTWAKSVLGSLLPEAMVAYLENHGVEKFSEIFLGEFDTPEAIWSAEMRRYLIERIALHLADFSPRITSNTRAIYDYCSIPAIVYENLTKELFCGNYYLRNLTNEDKFPAWPISDPLATLRDVIEAWKSEVQKKPPPMTVTEALRSLDLDENSAIDASSEMVKKSYRKLAQKFHPDKNPAGRARFEEANRAYEFLCSRYSSESLNPDMNRIVLILKTQSILFKQYQGVLSPYKYSGYPMLIKTIEIDLADSSLFAQETPLLPHSTQVVYHTLACSELNVEELRREKGLELLLKVFDRCLSVLSNSSKAEDVAVNVCIHVTRCFTVATKFQLCRDKLVEMPLLATYICGLFNFGHLTKLGCVASECVAAMSIDTILQMQLLQSGVLWHLLSSLFSYDYTLEESQIESSESSNQQILINNFAKSSVLALKSLCGDETTPINDVIRTSLEKLLLPYGAQMILSQPPEIVLKTLNSNTCSPYLIWNNKSRSELLEYCQQQLKLLKSGDITDMTYGSGFSYSIHEGELIIGSIFIRVYTTTPSFQLENPTSFITSLLAHLSNTDPDPSSSSSETPLVISALTLALKSNPGLETLAKGKFRLFAKFLICYCEVTLGLLGVLFGSQECVGDSVGCGILPGLMVISASHSEKTEVLINCLNCLDMASAHQAVVKEGVKKGLPIYLLSIFTSPTHDQLLRSKAAAVLNRLMNDKVTGPRVKLFLHKLLPPIFTEAMAESPETSVALFDSTTENPELLWNPATRSQLSYFITNQLSTLLSTQSKDLSADWEFNMDAAKNLHESNETIVGGIYLRIYNQNPNWNLRRPRDFLKDLLEHSFQSPSEECIKSIGILLSTNPHLMDNFVHMGYVPKVTSNLTSNEEGLRRFCVEVMRFFGNSKGVVECLSSYDSIPPLVSSLTSEKHVPLLCEGIQNIFSNKHPELVAQAVKFGLIPVLLSFLRGKDHVLAENGANCSGVKANIVHSLQNMAQDEVLGGEIEGILSGSEVWKGFRGQKHDLFLDTKSTSGYLQSGTSSTAGYLTQATNKTQPKPPPPL